MTRSPASIAAASLAGLTLSLAAQAASVNPFDPGLPAYLHAFATCNYTLEDVESEKACRSVRIPFSGLSLPMNNTPSRASKSPGEGSSARKFGTTWLFSMGTEASPIFSRANSVNAM